MVIMLGSFVVFRQIYLYIVSHFITNTLLPLAMQVHHASRTASRGAVLNRLQAWADSAPEMGA
mgnify:CR=1 FL=1